MWLEFIITFDRFFTIVYPKRFVFIKKRCFQITTILATIVFCFLVNISLPLGTRLDEVIEANVTSKRCHVSFETLRAMQNISLISTIAVNIVVNPILNVIVIRHIKSSRPNVRRLSRWTLNDRKFAISAIGINIKSLLWNIPFFTAILLSNLLDIELKTIYWISVNISFIGKSDILFLNLLANSVFRSEFLSMIGFYEWKSNRERRTNDANKNSDKRQESVLRDRELSDLIPRQPLC